MDVKRIDTALKAYEGLLASTDWERLKFFRGLWEVQDALNKELGERPDYKMCPEDVKAWYWSNTPLFSQVPPIIDEQDLSKAASSIAHYMVEHGGFDKEVAQLLNSFDWLGFIRTTQLSQAGEDPAAYLEGVGKQLQKYGTKVVDREEGARNSKNTSAPVYASGNVRSDPANKATGETLTDTEGKLSAGTDASHEPSSHSAINALRETIALSLSFALRPLFEQAAHKALSSVDVQKESSIHNKPLRCPACGCPAAAAFVGETPSGLSNGRLLYCALCGSEWEFERIRCACCGTTNQGKLHYYHLEGDEVHRLHSCDECGGYMRTVFQDSLAVPFCFEVEDVVMTRLDAAAQGSEK